MGRRGHSRVAHEPPRVAPSAAGAMHDFGSNVAHRPLGVRRALHQHLERGIAAHPVAGHQHVDGSHDDFSGTTQLEAALVVWWHGKTPNFRNSSSRYSLPGLGQILSHPRGLR